MILAAVFSTVVAAQAAGEIHPSRAGTKAVNNHILRAIGLTDGKPIASASLRTAGEPKEIRLLNDTSWQNVLDVVGAGTGWPPESVQSDGV